jgi:tetratricopeptide (TPR) repeat protein
MSFDFNPDNQERIAEMQPPQERIGRLNFVILAAFVVMSIVWLAWGPIRTAFKAAIGRHYAQEAMACISGNDLSGAVPQIIAARRWAPEDVEVIRAVIAFHKITGSDPAGLAQQLRLLAEKQPLTEEEELLLGTSLVTAGKTAEARKVYEKSSSAKSHSQSLELFSRILAAEGHTAEAAEISRRSISSKTDTPAARLRQALEDRGHAFVEVRRGAYQQLWELAAHDDENAIEAVAALAADPELSLSDARRLLQIAETHPHQSMNLRLRVVSALLRLQPERRDQIFDEEMARFQDGDEGKLADFAGWLAVEKQHARLVKLLPRDLAAKSRDLYSLLADALVNEGRWQELKEMLTNTRPPVSTALAGVWMAEVESHLQPDLAESRRLLQTSVDSARATGNLPALFAAAVCAEKLNLADIALTAYQAAAINDSESSVQLLQKAWELALLQKDTRAMLGITRRLHEMRPSSGVFADRFAYLRLVLGSELETATLDADKTGSASTKDRMPPELLRALAAYRFGDEPSMRSHLATVKISRSLPPGQRAVVAGLLSITGKAAAAFEIAETIPADLLLHEERAFLNLAR